MKKPSLLNGGGPFSMRFTEFNPMYNQYSGDACLNFRNRRRGISSSFTGSIRNAEPRPIMTGGKYKPAGSFGANFNKRFKNSNLNFNINVDPKGPQKVSAGIRYTF